jgi:hypothetical protein
LRPFRPGAGWDSSGVSMGVLRFLMDSPGKVCERPTADGRASAI